MSQGEKQIYVVYAAALFDGWEVVKENDDTPVSFATQEGAIFYAISRAATMDGGAFVKVENWFGDTERVLEIPAQTRAAVETREWAARLNASVSPK